MQLPSNNLNYPVRILIGDSSGSGFIISNDNYAYLVTAKHVLYRQDPATTNSILHSKSLRIVCHTFSPDAISQPPRIYEIDLDIISLNNNIKIHPTADVVLLKLGSISSESIIFVDGVSVLNSSTGAIINYSMSNARKFKDIVITNDVFVLGYPVSLSTPQMNQINYDIPLVRKGIIAGKNYENKTIILDCPVYGGNSGGLVLEMNEEESRIHLIGVVVQFVPFLDQWSNAKFPGLLNTNYQNSGYSIAIPVDVIYDLIQEINDEAIIKS